MNKGLKTILIIFSLVLLSIFLSVAAVNYSVESNPIDLSWLKDFVLSNKIAQVYLFWLAVVLAVLTIVLILFVIFYPKRITKFKLHESDGELLLDRRAIEGYVRTSIKQEDFVDNPHVKVRATKNKIRVTVDGKLKKTSGLIGRTDQWTKSVETRLQELLGSKEKISIEVKLHALEQRPSEKVTTTGSGSEPRVE